MTDLKQSEYGAARNAITDPRTILARAMQRATEADELHRHIEAAATAAELDGVDFVGVQSSALEIALAYTQIARAAIDLNAADPALAQADATDGAVRDDGPHALACRFTARFEAPSVGRIGGREWVLVPGSGWLDVTEAEHVGPEYARGGTAEVIFAGRAVSRYNDQVLVITGGGAALVLPAALVHLEADE